MNFQSYSDNFLDRTFLRLIPRSVTPNQVSWVRIVSLPFIFLLLSSGNLAAGFLLFVIAALTDALDGAMARKRDQVTEVGKVLDAVADRGLIALVAIMYVPALFGWPIFISLGCLEFINGLVAYSIRKQLGLNPGANWAGKIKMILQCSAFIAVFLSFFVNPALFLRLAYTLLLVSAACAIVQCFVYPTKAK